MEFDSCISKIQGALLSLHKRDLLNSKVSVKEVVLTLEEMMKTMSEDEKRKATYYMVLNTDLSSNEQLKEDENIYLFINDPILLNKSYLIDYVYALNLQNYLFDVFKNSLTLVTKEIIEELIRKLNEPDFHKAEYGIDHLYKLWEAVFVKMHMIELNHDDEGGEKMLDFFKEIYEIIRKGFFVFQMINKNSVVQFMGEYLYNFFNCILFFKNIDKHGSSLEMYRLCISQNCNKVRNWCEECLVMVFKQLPETLSQITIDLWMELSECEKGNQTYQEAIGNIVYELCEYEHFIPKDILLCLSAFKIKPKTPEIDEIIQEVYKGNKQYIKILIENLNLKDPKSLKCLMENSQQLDDDDVEFLLEKTQNGESDLIKKLFLNCLKLTKETKWLRGVLKKENFEKEDFHEDLIETFNKISNEQMSSWDVLSLFVQNSQKTLVKICECCVYNPQEVEFFVGILKQVKEFDYRGKDEIGEVILKHCKKVKNVIGLVKALKGGDVIGCEVLILLIEDVENKLKSCEEVTHKLEVVRGVVDMFVPDIDVIVLLCEISELMEFFNWDLYTFTKNKAEGREVLEGVVEILLGELRKQKPTTNKLEFLRDFISQKSESTQGVFCDLWFDFGEHWIGKGEHHSLLLALAYTNSDPKFLFQHLNEPSDFVFLRNSIVLSLYMILCVVPYRKWEILFSRLLQFIPKENNPLLEVFDIFISVLYFLSEKLNRNEKTLPVYEQSVRNIGRLIKFFNEKDNTDLAAVLIGKLMFALSAVNNREIRKNCYQILSSVVLELVDIIENGQDETAKGKVELELETLDVDDVVFAGKKQLFNS